MSKRALIVSWRRGTVGWASVATIREEGTVDRGGRGVDRGGGCVNWGGGGVRR